MAPGAVSSAEGTGLKGSSSLFLLVYRSENSGSAVLRLVSAGSSTASRVWRAGRIHMERCSMETPLSLLALQLTHTMPPKSAGAKNASHRYDGDALFVRFILLRQRVLRGRRRAFHGPLSEERRFCPAMPRGPCRPRWSTPSLPRAAPAYRGKWARSASSLRRG